jgi:hypothetical protein
MPPNTASHACVTALTGCGTLAGVRLRLTAFLTLVLLTSCASEPAPPTAPFTRVDLPAGAVPVRLAASGDDLVIAVRKGDKPGLIRHRHGANTELTLVPATGYGAQALWYSLAATGTEILAIGGKRGGAHGNVRWSVWRGDTTVAEQPQVFSTFGGLGAGDLVDGVLPTSGPLIVGTWQSASAGSDTALWKTDGTTWTRQSSAGTALESTRAALTFPMAAAADGADVVVVGWQFADRRQQPVVWTLHDGTASVAPLPDAGRLGVATSVTCADTCAIAGRVDGRLAVWRRAGNAWRRVADVPDVPVGDQDRPPAPVADTLVYGDRGTVRIATLGGNVRDASGPTGVVTAVARVGDTTYVLAGPDNNNQTLWRAD